MTSYSEDKAENGEEHHFPPGPDEGYGICRVRDERDGGNAGHKSRNIAFEGYSAHDVDQGAH